jgi:CubicO group peptidase (beta-lactamase class C family)
MSTEKREIPENMQADLRSKLDNYTTDLDNRGYINGSILVAYQGYVLLSKGFGMANIEHDIPNTSETKFRRG